jgi:hypothetical protein
MQTQIVKMINDFEHGRMSRRQLIAHLTGLFAASLGATIAFADQQSGRVSTIRTASNVRSRVRDSPSEGQ